MRQTFRKIDFARAAGITPGTVTSLCRGKLREAMTPNGRRIYCDHPAVVAYLEASHNPALQSSAMRNAKRNKPKPVTTHVPDPFATAARLASMPNSGVGGAGASGALARDSAPPNLSRPVGSTPTDGALFDLYNGTGGALLEDLEDLGALTLREVLDRWGTLRGLADGVKALKDFADMKNKESAAAQRRGQLVDRSLVSAVLVPLIDLAFRRLVTEMPVALGEQIIARVMAGGEDLRLDVEALIRRETSGILTDCRDGVALELQKVEGLPAPSKRGRPIGS